ncbi:DUF1392 domain-containing protein [Nostoc sp. 'Lobaria pulmonaria (5183) cyanobiont']|uniref:DUF1392 domain-containing protein n=1 Tax=Nostoc sp. 'Lobaria pulmonaria (5183) cyanobiont' TaxID=1618022 RepID=UPI000CF32B92|nr:DUF1392 domain-containing protein [Nostoc sp. 'Lobaria pulmonaria (5183) cyanobiont']AVH74282.1 protein of unknown function DUF1392 [Nostoc sp. 'Lobaria pulmonaria (5183) cyanobiont']
MIDHINALQTSWYLSPPWGRTIPPLAVNLLERVFLRTTRRFGYCCGMQWKHECWIYSIDCRNEILHATQNQIIATGELEVIKVQKPAFVLGERVILCSHDKGTKQRLILGIALVHNSWFYIVELVSPTLIKTPTISNRFSLVGEKSLMRVKV